jgi:putative transposase
MPWGLKRFQECRDIHFLTFSCYRRKPNLLSATACSTFLAALERVREQHQLCVYGYVIMPEHVHLLMNEPDRGTLAQAMQSLKQGVARRLALRAAESFWEALLRFQCLEPPQVCGKAALHSSESGKAWIGNTTP